VVAVAKPPARVSGEGRAAPVPADEVGGVPLMPLRVLTLHVHGSYLQYLEACGHEFLLPTCADRAQGFVAVERGERRATSDWCSASAGEPWRSSPSVHRVRRFAQSSCTPCRDAFHGDCRRAAPLHHEDQRPPVERGAQRPRVGAQCRTRERAGFDFLLRSDPFHPWLDRRATARSCGRCSAP
jgi:hypothetical protein